MKNGGVYEGVFKTYSPKVIFTIWLSLYGHAISWECNRSELTVDLAVELTRWYFAAHHPVYPVLKTTWIFLSRNKFLLFNDWFVYLKILYVLMICNHFQLCQLPEMCAELLLSVNTSVLQIHYNKNSLSFWGVLEFGCMTDYISKQDNDSQVFSWCLLLLWLAKYPSKYYLIMFLMFINFFI